MKLTSDKLAQHLNQTLLPVYVVAGEEPLLIEESLDAIRAAARAQGYEEREVHDVERGFDWGRIAESGASLSLFASRKLVELRMPKGPNPGRGKTSDDEESSAGSKGGKLDGAKLLVEWCEQPPQDVLLLVSAGKLDARQRKTKWYSALESAGASVYVWPIDAGRWSDWVAQRFRSASLSASPEAVQELADRAEGNALAAKQDIDKLALLYPQTEIGIEQVRQGVADSARYDAFDLGDRVLGGDLDGAARALARLREEGLDVLAVLGPLTWVLHQWSQVQAAVEKGSDASSACRSARVQMMRVRLYERASSRTRLTQIYGWLRQAAQVDRLAKSTLGRDQAWEELLTLVLSAAGRRIVPPVKL